MSTAGLPTGEGAQRKEAGTLGIEGEYAHEAVSQQVVMQRHKDDREKS